MVTAEHEEGPDGAAGGAKGPIDRPEVTLGPSPVRPARAGSLFDTLRNSEGDLEMTALSDRRTLPGLILVVIGLVLLGAQWFEITGFGALGAIAVVFLASYAITRSYGLLESGNDPQGGLTVVGLACGFFGIYVVDVLLAGHTVRWWPLIPGGILA